MGSEVETPPQSSDAVEPTENAQETAPAEVAPDASEQAEVLPEQPESLEETTPAKEKTDKADGDAQGREAAASAGELIYGAMLRSVFQELDLYTQGEGMALEVKKQLLVYHHAAKLHQLKDAVVGALKGEAWHAASLPVVYQRALARLRTEMEFPIDALKTKRIFGQFAIRFTQPGNLPGLARDACVYLRERPSATGDSRMKNPSVFRETIKFRCSKNPLTHGLEDPGLGIVIVVESQNPHAFMVVSPLLNDPEEVTRGASKTWDEIDEMWKDCLPGFVAREGQEWTKFMQKNAAIISKPSLRVLQKVLKKRQFEDPSGGGDGVVNGGNDEEVANLRRKLQRKEQELEEMRQEAEEIGLCQEAFCHALSRLPEPIFQHFEVSMRTAKRLRDARDEGFDMPLKPAKRRAVDTSEDLTTPKKKHEPAPEATGDSPTAVLKEDAVPTEEDMQSP